MTELPKLDLKKHFIKMGMSNLIEIIGEKRIEILSQITGSTINEVLISDLLIESMGEEIFEDNYLRGFVIHFLPDNYKSYLEYGDTTKHVSIEQEKILINRAWNRKFHSHSRLIEVFNLNNNYLPSIAEYNVDEIDIEPENKNINLTIWQKIVNFFKNLFGLQGKNNLQLGLFKFQDRIKDKVLEEIKKNNQKILIHMPTGSGKTRTALSSIIADNIMNNFFQTNFVIWVAHSDELCDQAKDTFEDLWKNFGSHKLKILRLKNQNYDYISNLNSGFIITTYQKLHSMRVNEHGTKILEFLRSKNKFIICDEAHMVPAETFMKGVEFIKKLDFTKIIGLSATPGGYYEEDTMRLSEYFGLKKISITDDNGNEVEDPIKFLQDNNFLARLEAHEVATDFEFHFNNEERQEILSHFELRQELLDEMGKDAKRNICIITELKRLYNENYNTIVFACSLEHAKLLHKLCILLKMKVGCIDDKTRPQRRKKIVNDYKSGEIKIIFNFGVLSTGFDAPNTNAVMIARPTTSPVVYSQMLGRGLRGTEFGGNKTCLLIDMKDNLIGLPDERRCFTIFNKYYNRRDQ